MTEEPAVKQPNKGACLLFGSQSTSSGQGQMEPSRTMMSLANAYSLPPEDMGPWIVVK